MFDNYTLKARVYPIIILFFPIIVIGIFYSFQFGAILLLLSSLGIASALMYLFSQLGRDQGKLREKKLWEVWGGSPTTQILRLKDHRIDKHTKQRYHSKLQILCPVPTVPNLIMENTDSEAADEVYKTWTKYLISKTRDTKVFSLLLKDNTSYGFRRNLWGLRVHGILLTTGLIICNYLFWIITLNSYNPLIFPDSFKYCTIILIVILLFWLFIVTRKWIKIPAFAYAERLCEATENL